MEECEKLKKRQKRTTKMKQKRKKKRKEKNATVRKFELFVEIFNITEKLTFS